MTVANLEILIIEYHKKKQLKAVIRVRTDEG